MKSLLVLSVGVLALMAPSAFADNSSGLKSVEKLELENSLLDFMGVQRSELALYDRGGGGRGGPGGNPGRGPDRGNPGRGPNHGGPGYGGPGRGGGGCGGDRRCGPPPGRRPPPPPPGRRPGYPPPPPRRPLPPPIHRPGYPPPGYAPRPTPGYGYYLCYAEDYYGRRYTGWDYDSARWAQDDALYTCDSNSVGCRPLGCSYVR